MLVIGCKGNPDVEKAAPADTKPAAVTNRIDIPGPVRSNLGITFARVERRPVANIIRVPGRFELLPTARVEHHTPLRGRVEILVQQLQQVKKGDVLYRLDSPAWRDIQRELSDTVGAIDIAEAQLKAIAPINEAHRAHEQGLQENIKLWAARKEKLEGLSTVVASQAQQLAEAQSKITEASSALGELKEKAAELELRRVETESQLRSAKAKQELLLTSVAALLSVSRDVLVAPENDSQEGLPYWHTVTSIDMRASIDGIVEQLAATNGSWTEEGALVLSVVDPTQVRFRAMGLQSDLDRLRTGLSATIINPAAKGEQANESISTQLELGLNADPEERTVELFARPSELTSWTRHGVSAFLEISTELTESEDLAIPLSAVVRDGLNYIIFRRDPANPDKAIRLEADLGVDDGRWIVVNSGVREGDEIVLDGVYQLLLATSGSIPKGGHFHADGTFHEGPDH
jgi:multidrug efflux pump subunit AcrA (membrane-fusion protein)